MDRPTDRPTESQFILSGSPSAMGETDGRGETDRQTDREAERQATFALLSLPSFLLPSSSNRCPNRRTSKLFCSSTDYRPSLSPLPLLQQLRSKSLLLCATLPLILSPSLPLSSLSPSSFLSPVRSIPTEAAAATTTAPSSSFKVAASAAATVPRPATREPGQKNRPGAALPPSVPPSLRRRPD